uniref:Uncharacterized protein n=1 Tax=Brassica oleracea TaxID=3712 RepID=A0A3P6C3F8_BRAOL|nr:unnamed protein product [Brassica oleracea]
MDVPKDQIATLMEHGLYDSAEMLGCFLVSSSTVSAEASPHLKAETLILLGDALFHRREYRRAIHTYKQALHHCARVPKQSSGISRSSLSLSTRSSVNASSVSSINENEVRFKIASSHFALSETKAAIAEMESVKTRSLEMNILMAKLHRNSGYNRGAIAFYKECLRQCPYVLEAIIGLAELGATAKDIISAFTQTSSRSTKVSLDQIDPTRWLQRYVEAQCCVASHAYKGALELFAELLQRFPNNVHLLTETAKVEAIIGKNDEAIMRFEKVVRSIDPYTLTCMDEYAMLLQMKCDYSRLNKLVHDLLSIDHTRAEVFVALSVLWERKDPRTALSYAEKSIRVDERHIPGYIVKGNFLLLAKRPEAAAIAFRAAQNLRSDLRSYQGLVHSYLAFGKTKEALYTAREAMNAMPQSAKALKLVGDVHANTSSGREKAKKFYESALRLEPGYLGAAIALADLHLMEGRNGDAVSLLERYLKDWADESLHVKLAQVFAATNMLQDSLSHYQAALRINPQNEAAKKGLDRLEKQMKGIDPDAADENDENDVEDVDGDTEEAELISRIPSTLFSKQSTLASLYSLNKFALRREYKLSFSLSLSTTSSMIVTPIHASSSSSSTIGETSDGLKVQSHVSIGANDLLIVGAGVLGRLVAEKWREEHPDCQIIGQTVTINHHNELEKLGIKPALKETEFDGKFSYVIFCAPPSQSPDYAAELRTAASKWNGEGSFLFTSSSAPFDCFDNGECNEDSPVVPLGKSPRTDVLLRAEQVVLEKTRGAHNYWLNKETVDARPDHILNLIHYEDAASLAVAIMKKKAGGRIFLGCDNHPLSRQEVMDLMAQSGKYDKEFKGFTSTTGPLGKKLNNSRTRAEIGWEPKYPSFAQFLGVTK